ncbi:hypothetical protein HDU96_008412 [Phlyctochytrium bullatum]|nr:hypothetical protein HDU96_008412 [Phlyctochytrium bullatum]
MKTLPMGSFMLKLTAPNPRKTSCENCRSKKLKCDGSHRLCERRKTPNGNVPTPNITSTNPSTPSSVSSTVPTANPKQTFIFHNASTPSFTSASTTGNHSKRPATAQSTDVPPPRENLVTSWKLDTRPVARRKDKAPPKEDSRSGQREQEEAPPSVSASRKPLPYLTPNVDHHPHAPYPQHPCHQYTYPAYTAFIDAPTGTYPSYPAYNTSAYPRHPYYDPSSTSAMIPTRRPYPFTYHPLEPPVASFLRPSFDPLVDVLSQINRTFEYNDRRADAAPPSASKRRRITLSAEKDDAELAPIKGGWGIGGNTGDAHALEHCPGRRETPPDAGGRRHPGPPPPNQYPWSGGYFPPHAYGRGGYDYPAAPSASTDGLPTPGTLYPAYPQPQPPASRPPSELTYPAQMGGKVSGEPPMREFVPLTVPTGVGTVSAPPSSSDTPGDSASPPTTKPDRTVSSVTPPPCEDELGHVERMLLSGFFRSKAESIIEVIHRPSFAAKLSTRLPVLRYAVCAYAAHHSYPKAPFNVTRKYYVKARDLAKASIERPGFQVLQALILLRALAMALCDNSHGFFFLEAALEMSTKLGLKTKAMPEDDCDFMEMKKCWMACFFHDRIGAIASGQAHFLPVIGGLHQSVQLDAAEAATLPTPSSHDGSHDGSADAEPTPGGDSSSEAPKPLPPPTSSSLTIPHPPDPLDHLMRILDIAYVVHNAAKKPLATEDDLLRMWDSLERAEARLSSWAFGVPVWMLSEPTLEWCMQTFHPWNNHLPPAEIPWSALTVLFLYHLLRCFLHRPRLSLELNLAGKYRGSVGGAASTNRGGPAPAEDAAKLVSKLEALGIPGAVEATAESAFIVARTTAKILEADPDMKDMNPPFAFCLTTAAVAPHAGVSDQDLAPSPGLRCTAAGLPNPPLVNTAAFARPIARHAPAHHALRSVHIRSGTVPELQYRPGGLVAATNPAINACRRRGHQS